MYICRLPALPREKPQIRPGGMFEGVGLIDDSDETGREKSHIVVSTDKTHVAGIEKYE
jgi:hypothetical protein